MSYHRLFKLILLISLVFILFGIFEIASSQNQITQIANKVNLFGNLDAIDFVDGLSGWFVGSSGLVVHTPDGGQTWKELNVGHNVFLNAVDFVSENEGWVAGTKRGNIGIGIILHTEDAGVSWEVLHEDSFGGFLVITFFNSQIGWAGGKNNYILYTNDGGRTWEKSTPNLPGSHVLSIVFNDSLNGWAEGFASGIHGLPLLHSKDGGRTWQADSTIIGAEKVAFTDSLHGWAVGASKLWRTIDGGKNWELYSMPFIPNWQLINIYFVDSLYGYVSNEAGMFSTRDGGIIWDLVSDERGLDIYFTTRNFGWGVWVTVGGVGAKKLAYTSDGGTTWTEVISTSVDKFFKNSNNPLKFSLHANYPNPFNSETIISFEVLKPNAKVNLVVYNQLGQKTVVLLDTFFPSGKHSVLWSGEDENNEKVPTGIYFYRLSSGDIQQTKKMLILQ